MKAHRIYLNPNPKSVSFRVDASADGLVARSPWESESLLHIGFALVGLGLLISIIEQA